MTISATIATSSATTVASRAPISHDGTTAGITILRIVVHREKCSIRATSYWRGCTAATPPAVLNTTGQRAAYTARITSEVVNGPNVSTTTGTSATAGIVRRKSTEAMV